ncbi:butyrate kinase [Paramaledivibacter caminithermalis]|jgi:butyrate kinase|uniref:Probable butyrate kinase n=1 Tax=Paramaledivibacter caminithermalis (strain DSM 15212 / CIP 107654 / DViRD3) TaxID=1121301 RepID=A0A1M6QD85_PARC5|nr:butyrate kinase [Paramaledivibacter caminithermalis]SHK18264.1 butyrate kinase [Paramaledivibacter caminithermalis DSM 15212]
MNREYVLVINPGSTSTKVAIFQDRENVLQKNLSHASEELDKYEKITDQFEYRKNIILDWLKGEGYETSQLKAVVGRGGLLKPMPSGTYIVTDVMIDDLRIGVQGEHASNLGGIIAKSIADIEGINSYIVDPVAVDEFDDVARISGMAEIKRRSLLHALNIKAVAHNIAKQKNKKVDDLNLVIAHLGGGISVVPLRKGKMIDANNANEMGPFSPERTGGLPVGDVAKMCFSGKYTYPEMKKKMRGKGGLVAYLGTNDAREVVKMIENGDERAKLIYEAMGYQIAKEIGAMAVVLNGEVDAIVLTGGIAHSKMLTDYIQDMVEFIAPVILQPGEDEMRALNEGVLRVLSGEEEAKIYENEVK